MRPILLLLSIVGCAGGGSTDTATDDGSSNTGAIDLVFYNSGDSEMEGHTPINFQGQGGGVFAGDNINGNFPNTVDDGVQIWLSLDFKKAKDGTVFSSADHGWTVDSAVLSSDNVDFNGTPFETLGDLVATEVQYDAFSSDLWDLEPENGAFSAVFGDSADGPFEVDITDPVQAAVDAGERYVQFNIRFDNAGDADGVADMILFNLGDTNNTAPKIFQVDVTATAE